MGGQWDMISGIGISPLLPGSGQSSATPGVQGAGRAEQDAKPAVEKPAGENVTGRASDPVAVKPTNIGGGSAIAAQIEASRQTADGAGEKTGDAGGLTEEERAQVKKLAARDREVRAHEAAHQAVGGQYAGAASFSYQSGPDGRRYAVGGEVPIDTGAVPGNPEATITKLRTVRRAALAPAEPSAQDRSIAARAEAGVRQAQAQRQIERLEQRAEAAKTDEVGADDLVDPSIPPALTNG
jgi:hypothetical protein